MSIRILTTSLLLAGLFTLSALDVQAAERHRAGTIAGSGGRAATLKKDLVRNGADTSLSSSVQGANGRGATRNVTGDYDQAAGTYNRNGNVTGNDGRSASSAINAARTENGGTSNATVTGPNGGSASTSAGTDCTDTSCTRSAQRTVTAPNGQQVSNSSTSSVSKTGGN